MNNIEIMVAFFCSEFRFRNVQRIKPVILIILTLKENVKIKLRSLEG